MFYEINEQEPLMKLFSRQDDFVVYVLRNRWSIEEITCNSSNITVKLWLRLSKHLLYDNGNKQSLDTKLWAILASNLSKISVVDLVTWI